MKYGIIIMTADKYYLCAAAYSSILAIRGLERCSFMICDDRSTDCRQRQINDDFVRNLKNQSIPVQYNAYSDKKGVENITRSFEDAKSIDCEYILYFPSDFVYNEYILNVADLAVETFKENVGAVSFFRDQRIGKMWMNIGARCNEVFNRYFDHVNFLDTGGFMFKMDFYRTIPFALERFAYNLSRYIYNKGKSIVMYKESLCEHIGNLDSHFGTPDGKRGARVDTDEIHAVNLNILNKPQILQ